MNCVLCTSTVQYLETPFPGKWAKNTSIPPSKITRPYDTILRRESPTTQQTVQSPMPKFLGYVDPSDAVVLPWALMGNWSARACMVYGNFGDIILKI